MVGILSHTVDKWSSSHCPSISGVKEGFLLLNKKAGTEKGAQILTVSIY